MRLIRVAKIKLNISANEVRPTISAYSKAFNLICQIGFESKDKNGVSLHKKTYSETREYLPSQLAISARMKATEALKGIFAKGKDASCPKAHSHQSIRLDVNSYSLFLKTQEVSFLTISGRKRLAFAIPEYYQEYFDSWKHKTADLCIKKNKVFLHIVFEKDVADSIPNNEVVGIDRGINNLAVSSNNKFFGGGKVKKIVRRNQRLRSRLQRKGTRSAKRHLARLSGKERRFRADINHQISKNIVMLLVPGSTIALENLSGIRNQRLRKKMRTLINSWSFYQLEQFITYKALANGIVVLHVDARYTSQGCSRCGHIDPHNRKGSAFCCLECGLKLNADLNASRNIAQRAMGDNGIKHLASYKDADRASVNEPIVSIGLTC